MRYRPAKSSSNRSVYISRLIIFPLVIFLIIVVLNRFSEFFTIKSEGHEFLFTRSVLPPSEENRYNVYFYDLSLDVHFSPHFKQNKILGINKIYFVARKPALRKIVLNFNSTLKVDSVAGMGLDYLRRKGLLYIDLNKQLNKNDTGMVKIYFSGWPSPYHPWLGGWNFKVRRRKSDLKEIPWVATINPPFGAQTWFPCKDMPADKADSAIIRITVPDSLQAISNGTLVKTVPLGNHRRQYIWKEHYPIATYLMAVNISQYVTYSWQYRNPGFPSFPVYFYGFEADSSAYDSLQQELKSMLDFFQNLLGPYPFANEKYAMIRYNTSGGMENQTITGVQSLDPSRRNLFAHELSHQWAGDMVTNGDFSESFLNEGLATYLTALYIRHVDGNQAFKAYLDKFRVMDAGPIHVKKILVPDSVYHTQRVYHKGALFFHMLRDMVGDSCFFRSLKLYFQKYAYRSVKSQNLRQIFEQECHRNLRLFFKSWLNNGGAPQLKVQLKNGRRRPIGSEYEYELKIEQQQKGNAFYLYLPVVLHSEKGDSSIRIEVKKKKSKFKFTASAPIDSVTIDPSKNWLISWEFHRSDN